MSSAFVFHFEAANFKLRTALPCLKAYHLSNPIRTWLLQRLTLTSREMTIFSAQASHLGGFRTALPCVRTYGIGEPIRTWLIQRLAWAPLKNWGLTISSLSDLPPEVTPLLLLPPPLLPVGDMGLMELCKLRNRFSVTFMVCVTTASAARSHTEALKIPTRCSQTSQLQ